MAFPPSDIIVSMVCTYIHSATQCDIVRQCMIGGTERGGTVLYRSMDPKKEIDTN